MISFQSCLMYYYTAAVDTDMGAPCAMLWHMQNPFFIAWTSQPEWTTCNSITGDCRSQDIDLVLSDDIGSKNVR